MAADYTRPATIASGQLQVIGGSQKDKFVGQVTNADGTTWNTHTPTAGRKVLEWILVNTGNVKLDLGLGESAKSIPLEVGESISIPWNGALHVKSASAAAGAYDAVAIEA